MDFRDPNIAGTFVYHCHVLDHEDAGMMGKIPSNRRRLTGGGGMNHRRWLQSLHGGL
jgi:hypothetical protein